ncbi:MAG: hypothetical protein LCH80_03965 [Proteobacteria bacterium]|nr:hypothetical protein [Pseudomonadota bacterium]
MAVAELFAHFDGDVMAGYRAVGMAPWDQRAAADWTADGSNGPNPAMLPSDFWVIGLDHLGQAYLWTIGTLPFADPSQVRLPLQDGAEQPEDSHGNNRRSWGGFEFYVKLDF